MQITEFCGRRSLYKGKCIQDRRQCHQGQKISDNLKAIQSVTQLCPTLGDPMSCSMPGSPVHHQLLELSPTHVHWVSEAIQPSQLCHHFLLLPSVFASIRVFSNESLLRIRWPKYWSVCVCIPSILSFLHCPYKHKIILSTSTKKSCWHLIGIAYQFGENWHLY